MVKKKGLKIGPSKLDRFFHSARIFTQRYQGSIQTYLCGFLTGIFINVVSGSEFDKLITFPRNVIIGFSIVVIATLWIFRKILEWHYRKTRWESWFAKLLRERVDPVASPFADDVLAWGPIITVTQCPDLSQGWRLSKVRLKRQSYQFELPHNYREPYNHYYEENYQKKRFFDDGTKFMLTKNPSAFTDSPTLVLEIKETRYSTVLFYREQVMATGSDRDRLIEDFVKCKDTSPQAFGMQVVVITKDDKILATLRSPKVEHDPNTWSVSLEEQLSADKDFLGDTEGIVLRWGKRLLEEELGVDKFAYDDENLRILTVMLECYIVNCSLLGVFKLAITAEELDNRLKSMVRPDYEFQKWKFLTFKQLVSELRFRKELYPLHPSSGYRMLLVLIHKYGIPGLAEKMFGSELETEE